MRSHALNMSARAHVSECVYVNEITCEIHYSTVPEI